MTDDGKLPALRRLDITPFQDEHGKLYFQLRDMLQVSPNPLAISGAGYFVLAHLDGAHTVQDVQEAFKRESGQDVPAEEIERVVAVLDHYAMLDTPRFAEAYTAAQSVYLASQYRDNRDRWPAAEAVRAEIKQILMGEHPEPVTELRGLIAPHLDYRRGAPCYAAAYSLLAQAPAAERYVILGTNHFGHSSCVVATTKDFQTPLGLVPTDRAFISRLEQRLGMGVCGCEFDHRVEHSVELQVHLLQACRGEDGFEIVPILCPDICGPTGTAPGDGEGPDLGVFADTLASVIAEDDRRTVLIAAADLSHVGVAFDDEKPATPEFLAEVERHDRAALARLEADDAEGFVAAVRATDNATRICSVGCLYAMRRALQGRPCRVLHYHQAVDGASDTNVTCAAAVIC